VADFSHTVRIARPPADVFPWLFDADKVPQWTGNLDGYEAPERLGLGAKLRQRLTVGSQRLDLELEITRYEPPRRAETRFSTNGIDAVTAYELAGDGQTELTQTLEAKAGSFGARMLLPVVKPRLERKLAEDLERLRALLDGA
jgi:uncharacterized protein YndB with AHSA1/START domain